MNRSIFESLLAVFRKEVLHIWRDKRTLMLIVMMPFMQLILYGYAINTDIQHLKLAVLDEEKSSFSRRYIEALVQSGYFDVHKYASSPTQLKKLLDRGEVKASLHIPFDFSKKALSGQKTGMGFYVDGSDSNPASIALARAADITAAFEKSEKLAQSRNVLELCARMWYNPELKSPLFMIPGLVGLLLQLLVPMITATAIVREKERATLEQLLVTPLTRLEIILGKIIPYILIGIFIMSLILFVAYVWFAVPIRGDLFTLFTLTLFYIIVCLGMGLLASTLAQNQQQAAQMVMFFAAPSILLSGFVFPRETMPFPIYASTFLIPLTYYLKISRGIMLKGLNFSDLIVEASILLAMAGLLLFLSAKKFKKQL